MSNKDFQNGFALGMASGGVVEVVDTTEIDNLEDLIDNSGVLEDTDGSVSEKVEQLIDLAKKGKNDTLKQFFCNTLTEYTITDEFSIDAMRLSYRKLEKFSAPNLVGDASSYLFYGCTCLHYLDLGKITSFSSFAINGIHSLETIILRNTEAVVTLDRAFSNNHSIVKEDIGTYCYFYVPKALLEDYKVATNWSNYANRFRAIEDYPEITGGVI